MNDIVIYRTEASVPNLVEKIQGNRVIAYTMPLIPWQPEKPHEVPVPVAFAGAGDSDLYYTKSILVTTNWNKNDDVFDKVETWAARNTPTHKPTNIEHDEKKLVGHMTDCWAITSTGEIIPDNTLVDDLPDIYHLVNGAVIYKGWRDPQLIEQSAKLIQQIEAGEKFVSMECLFSNFGYALMKGDKCHVVARDENTAWMTKHLRVYGGEGECEGYKIGRLLRNITFCGKGYVDKPANPNSIIFNDTGMFRFSAISSKNPLILENGVNNTIEENNTMSSEIDTLKVQLEETKASLKLAEDKLAKADTEKFEIQIADLTNQLTISKTEIETYKTNLTKLTEVEKTLADLQKVNADLTKQIEEMNRQQILAKRTTILVDGGLDRETADKKVALYANLTDEQFGDLSKDLIVAAKPKEEKPKKKDEKQNDEDDKAGEVNADTQVLETVIETPIPSLAAAIDQVDETAELRKALQSALASRLGVKLEEENK